jgi:hypothetical protein
MAQRSLDNLLSLPQGDEEERCQFHHAVGVTDKSDLKLIKYSSKHIAHLIYRVSFFVVIPVKFPGKF